MNSINQYNYSYKFPICILNIKSFLFFRSHIFFNHHILPHLSMFKELKKKSIKNIYFQNYICFFRNFITMMFLSIHNIIIFWLKLLLVVSCSAKSIEFANDDDELKKVLEKKLDYSLFSGTHF